jgi:hypothetical protein
MTEQEHKSQLAMILGPEPASGTLDWFTWQLSSSVSLRQQAVASQAAVPAPETNEVLQPEKKTRVRKTKSEYAAAPPAVRKPREDKSKGGRPEVKEEEKLKCISTFVSPARAAYLHEMAAKLNMRISHIVRPMVEPHSVRGQRRMAQAMGHGLSVEERGHLRELAGMTSNLNELAKLARTSGYAAAAADLTDLAIKVRSQINLFSGSKQRAK